MMILLTSLTTIKQTLTQLNIIKGNRFFWIYVPFCASFTTTFTTTSIIVLDFLHDAQLIIVDVCQGSNFFFTFTLFHCLGFCLFIYLFIYLTFQPLEFLAKKMFLHFLHCHFLPSRQILVPKTFWGRSPPTSPGRSLKILFDHPGDVPIWRPEDVLKWRPRDVLIWCPRDNPARLIRGFLKVIQ